MAHFETVQQIVAEGQRSGAYPAAALAVGIGETIYVRETYGDCRMDTMFDLASVSKIVGTTMVALRFWEMGKLSLTDSVSSFFPNAPLEKQPITIAQLMTHTGGFCPFFFLSKYAAAPAQAVDALLTYPLQYAPGGEPVYSCMGYILLGKILERIGGAPLDQLAERYVFQPLGLAHTGYHPHGDIAPTERDATTGELLRGVVHDENARFLGGISGNAGIFSDIHDMTRFTQMLALGGGWPGTPPFLQPETLADALLNRTPHSHGEYRALGFQLIGSSGCFLGDQMSRRAYGHTGFTGTSFAVDPETKLWVVLLTNRVCPTRDDLRLVHLRPLLHNAAALEARQLCSGK